MLKALCGQYRIGQDYHLPHSKHYTSNASAGHMYFFLIDTSYYWSYM